MISQPFAVAFVVSDITVKGYPPVFNHGFHIFKRNYSQSALCFADIAVNLSRISAEYQRVALYLEIGASCYSSRRRFGYCISDKAYEHPQRNASARYAQPNGNKACLRPQTVLKYQRHKAKQYRYGKYGT